MQSQHQIRVESFMNKVTEMGGKQQVPGKPGVPDPETRLLRAKLIFEEAMEALEAMGVAYEVSYPDPGNPYKTEFVLGVDPSYDVDINEVAKELADLSVVNVGTMSAFGIKDEHILKAVDENNLAKVGPGASINEYGKLVKPKDHKKPDIKAILESQGE